MAVLPENMDKLNPEDSRQSFSILENYIRYMGERIEFAMRNVTRNVAAAGVSSAEIYVLLTALNHELSALKSTVNTQGGSITGILKTLGDMEDALAALEKIVPISHEWDGTVLKVTSNSGTSEAELKGDKGDPGTTPHVGENGNWWIGTTDTGVLAEGKNGVDGTTPVKGVDYFTPADKGEIVSQVIAGLPTGTVSNAVTLSTAQTVTGVKTFTASNLFDGEQKLTFGQYCPTVTDIAAGIGASMKNARAVDCQLYVAEVYAPYWSADITHGGKEAVSGLTATVNQIDFYVITGAAGGQPTGRKLIMQMKEDGLYVLGKKVLTE